ncbi:MAG TPA: PAS domain S-box protein [Gemmatimonadales bacterium]
MAVAIVLWRRLSRDHRASETGADRAYFEQLFESAPEAVVLASNNSRVIRVNGAFTRMFGFTAHEASGRSLDELLAPADLQEEAKSATRSVAEGADVAFETVRRRKDGSTLHVSILGTPIRLAGGQVAVYGMYRDITDMKRTVDALKESEELFAHAFRSSPGLAVISERASGRIREVNDAFMETTGYTHAEVVGRTKSEIGLWVDPAARAEALRVLDRDGIVRNFEYAFRVKDGEERWGLYSADVFEMRGEQCVLALTNDITERRRALAALAESEARYRTILATIEDGYYEVDTAGNIRDFNDALERLLGYPAATLRGMNNRGYMDEENARRVFRTFNEVYATGAAARIFDWEVIRGDGTRRLVEASVTAVKDHAGWVTGFRGIVRDVTERKKTERALRESEERYALASRGANDGLWDWDLRSGLVYYSPRWRAMLGYSESEVGRRPEDWFQRVHPDDVERLKGEITSHLDGPSPHFESEHRILHKDGSYRWVLCRGVAERNGIGKALRMAGSQTDVSGRKSAEERLIHDAFHDVLTGLPNRALFATLLERSIARLRRRNEYRFAVLFLDIDRFKVVNDSLGHLVGDKLLMAVSERLGGCLRPGDTVARLGGDEFTVLLDDITGEEDALRIAERIQSELMTSFTIGTHEIFTSTSIGIALSTPHYRTPSEILRDADTAMYNAKAAGKARHEVFQQGMHQHAVTLLRLETDLRYALDRQEFRLVYQPIISLASGQLSGFEALLRWDHPERGLVAPTEFIQLAEETGLIIGIGQWALWEACRQTSEWQAIPRNGASPLMVSVNLSPRQFKEGDLVESVADALSVTGLPAAALKLEITESVLMDRAENSARLLDELKHSGVQVQVDDFGTGYSSLGYLHRFSLDALKIDQSFVSRIGIDMENTEIVRTIVTLARNLGMAVVAEGVETEHQRAYLETLECDQVQGFLFAGPLDVTDAEELLHSGRHWCRDQ